MKSHLALMISCLCASVSCHATPKNIRDLGVVNILQKETEYSVVGAIPSRPEGSPWGLIFLPAKRGNEKIKVYLRNDNPDLLTFYKGKEGGYLKLKPGERGLIFEDSLDKLAGVGRGEVSELTFGSTTNKEIRFSLSFVSNAEEVGEIKISSKYLLTGY